MLISVRVRYPSGMEVDMVAEENSPALNVLYETPRITILEVRTIGTGSALEWVTNESEKASLSPDHFLALVDLALDMKDERWFRSLMDRRAAAIRSLRRRGKLVE